MKMRASSSRGVYWRRGSNSRLLFCSYSKKPVSKRLLRRSFQNVVTMVSTHYHLERADRRPVRRELGPECVELARVLPGQERFPREQSVGHGVLR
jgi:hypothetical protein